jgi:hypothetical protein
MDVDGPLPSNVMMDDFDDGLPTEVMSNIDPPSDVAPPSEHSDGNNDVSIRPPSVVPSGGGGIPSFSELDSMLSSEFLNDDDDHDGGPPSDSGPPSDGASPFEDNDDGNNEVSTQPPSIVASGDGGIPSFSHSDSMMLPEANAWDCKLLFNQSPPGRGEDLVDLCDHLGSGLNYQFPPRFHGPECRGALETELKFAAIQCGYKLYVSTSNNPSKRTEYTQRAIEVNVACQCSRVHTSCRKLSNSRILTSVWPRKKDQVCPFRFVIYMCSDGKGERSNRWFLASRPKTKINSCRTHKFHLPVKPKHPRTSMSPLSPSEIELAKQCAQVDSPAPAVAAILNVRNTKGHTATKQQVNQTKRLGKQLKNGDLNHDATSNCSETHPRPRSERGRELC